MMDESQGLRQGLNMEGQLGFNWLAVGIWKKAYIKDKRCDAVMMIERHE